MPGYIVRQRLVIDTTQYVEAATEQEAIAKAEYLAMPISFPHVTVELTPGRVTVTPAPE